MNLSLQRFVMRNSTFAWIALATVLLLSIPLIAMCFTSEVNWSIADFAIMGILLFGAGSAFVMIARKSPRKHWALIGMLLVVAVLYLWAELAVGVFTDLGN